MSNKKKNLKNSLKNGDLLIGGDLTGGNLIGGDLTGTDRITGFTGSPNKSVSLNYVYNQAINASAALTRVEYVEDAIGNKETINGKKGVNYLKTYVSQGAAATPYVPNTVVKSGLLGWVADQIKVAVPPPVQHDVVGDINTYLSVPSNTNNNVIIPLGQPLSIGGTPYVNRVLTLQDLMGVMDPATGILSFAPDVQAAIELSPLAQFKHLPSIASLNTVIAPPPV